MKQQTETFGCKNQFHNGRWARKTSRSPCIKDGDQINNSIAHVTKAQLSSVESL